MVNTANNDQNWPNNANPDQNNPSHFGQVKDGAAGSNENWANRDQNQNWPTKPNPKLNVSGSNENWANLNQNFTGGDPNPLQDSQHPNPNINWDGSTDSSYTDGRGDGGAQPVRDWKNNPKYANNNWDQPKYKELANSLRNVVDVGKVDDSATQKIMEVANILERTHNRPQYKSANSHPDYIDEQRRKRGDTWHANNSTWERKGETWNKKTQTFDQGQQNQRGPQGQYGQNQNGPQGRGPLNSDQRRNGSNENWAPNSPVFSGNGKPLTDPSNTDANYSGDLKKNLAGSPNNLANIDPDYIIKNDPDLANRNIANTNPNYNSDFKKNLTGSVNRVANTNPTDPKWKAGKVVPTSTPVRTPTPKV